MRERLSKSWETIQNVPEKIVENTFLVIGVGILIASVKLAEIMGKKIKRETQERNTHLKG